MSSSQVECDKKLPQELFVSPSRAIERYRSIQWSFLSRTFWDYLQSDLWYGNRQRTLMPRELPTRCCRTISYHPAASATKAATFRRYPSYSGPLYWNSPVMMHSQLLLSTIWSEFGRWMLHMLLYDYGLVISAHPKHESETIDRPTCSSHLKAFFCLCQFIPHCF